MQIGDPQMDRVYEDAIEPAISDAGLAPLRVDRHNQGDLLKSEIVRFIETSEVIVADITNERPNCYLEIGYAMGLGKKRNLILTAREDHHHQSPNFNQGGPRVHFDLEGYAIIFWDPEDLSGFREELGRAISRRRATVRPAAMSVPIAAPGPWHEELRAIAETGIAGVGRSAYMEVAAEVESAQSFGQQELLQALRDSSIHTFGWPIGVILDGDADARPHPTTDGVQAEVAIASEAAQNPFGQDRTSYDFWKLFRDGRFYTMLSLFEDERAENAVFFDVRISRVTEALLLLARLYRRLGLADTDRIAVSVRHQGIAGRTIRAANRGRYLNERSTGEDCVETTITATLAELERDLTNYVRQVVDPLFVVFDFLQIDEGIVSELVEDFLAERIR